MKTLTIARDLRRRKARERQGLFVCEGVRAVEELLRSDIPPLGALVAPELASTPRGAERRAALDRVCDVAEVSEAEFASAADTETPQGVLAIARTPARQLSDLPVSGPLRLLVIDGVQDPGNTGTIIRTAAALGFDGTVALPGTVDLWNAKVVRSAMGAHFHHLAFTAGWEELNRFRADSAVTLWAADASGEAIETVHPPERLALVVGNEGSGLSTLARQASDRLVALPISSAVESLNVAVATGILLYLLRR